MGQGEDAEVLEQGVAVLGAVHFGRGRCAHFGVCEGGFFGVDAAAEGEGGRGRGAEVAGRVGVVGGGADALVALALDVPGGAVVRWVRGVEGDVAHFEDHLDAAVPEFLLQVHADGGVVAGVLIEVFGDVAAALFGGEEGAW